MSTNTEFSEFIVRSGLKRSARKLKNGNAMTVAFIGGSVTVGAGASDESDTSYRALTCKYLKQRFPQTFHFVNAAIGGTDSSYGAFRLKEHVFKHGPVDLLFVEFAVNDSGNRTMSVRAMEGIVRQAKRFNPHIDICFLYLANQPGAEHYSRTGRPQDNVIHHEDVAEHYGIPSIHIANRIYRMIESGAVRWEDLSGDAVHPNDHGYSLYARFLQHFLEEVLVADDSDTLNFPVLPSPMDPYCYENADLISTQKVVNVSGWRMVRGWTTEQTCSWRPPADILLGETPGAGFQIRFTGTAVGIVLLIGMDTGDIDFSIDGGQYRTVQIFDRHCELFYRPRIVLFADDLVPAPHTVDIRISDQKHERSVGHAIRILNLLVNERRISP